MSAPEPPLPSEWLARAPGYVSQEIAFARDFQDEDQKEDGLLELLVREAEIEKLRVGLELFSAALKERGL